MSILNAAPELKSLPTPSLDRARDSRIRDIPGFRFQGSKFVEFQSAENVKRTWVNYGASRDWMDSSQGQGEEFLYHSTQCKNIWLPMGVTFSN